MYVYVCIHTYTYMYTHIYMAYPQLRARGLSTLEGYLDAFQSYPPLVLEPPKVKKVAVPPPPGS